MVVSNMRRDVYREWVPAGSLVKILVGSISSLTLCALLILVLTGLAFQNLFWVLVPSSALVFLLLLFWNYRGIEIRLSNKKLLIDYGLLNHKSFSLEDIVSCEPTDASFRRYGGVGVRYGFDGSWAYTTSFGDAVKITPRKGRHFVFSSSNPRRICDIICQIKSGKSTLKAQKQ